MKSSVDRIGLSNRIKAALRANPVVALLGPRQCGKTTLARLHASSTPSVFFDLEDPGDAARLRNPMSTLEALKGLVVIDEIQRAPEVLDCLRVLVDRPGSSTRFLLLGSASPELAHAGAQTLAGRVAFIDMAGFDLSEVGNDKQRRLWIRGGFPRSFLARSEAASVEWRGNFIRTFLERDLAQLGVRTPSQAMRRLWMMLAHSHGQVLNASDIGRSLGEAHTTVKRHIDVLTGAYVVRQLQPWFANLAKRQVKSPKIYIRDSGILHALLEIPDFAGLNGHPKLGASWEGFVLESAIGILGERNVYYWATQAGAELDLYFVHNGRPHGIEIKFADAPSTTRSMHAAIADLDLHALFVVYPGSHRYRMDERIEAVPLAQLREVLGKPQ